MARIARLVVLLLCMSVAGVYSLECVTCEYDEFWYDTNRACLTDPGSITTKTTCNTRCYTYAYRDTFAASSSAGDLNVKRGCDSNDLYQWDNSCNYTTVSFEDVFLCTCTNSDNCNAVDTDKGFQLCHQCNTQDDDDAGEVCDTSADGLLPCLTGEEKCGVLTVNYDSWLFTDVVYRYCTDETHGTNGDCTDGSFGSTECKYSCEQSGCVAHTGSGCSGLVASVGLLAVMFFLAFRV